MLCAVLSALSSTTPAIAADANGVAVCTAANDQVLPVIVSDGAGGAIVAWHDSRPTAAAGGVCFAQRVNAVGVPQWAADGVALSTTGDSGPPVMVSDGAGGAFIAYGGVNSPPHVQHVSAGGTPQWGADGVQLTLAVSTRDLAIAPDVNGAGGAIVAWRQDNGAGGTSDLHAQKVNSAGATQWGSSGVPVAVTSMNSEALPALISDGAGGAFITWFNGTNGCRAQRLDAAGTNQWSNTSLSGTTNNNPPSIVSDGAGGVVVAWAGAGIYAQRVDGFGTKQWNPTNAGVALATTGNLLAMIPDGAGGATVAWQDFRSGTNYNIYAQRVDGAGATQWVLNGVEVCFVTGDQLAPTMVSDGGTGAILSWFDGRSVPTGDDIYVERIDAAGVSQWTPDGLPLCTAANDQQYPTTASDGAGGAFVAWQDRRSGTNQDIYLQRINPNGQALSVPRGGPPAARAWPNPFSDRVQLAFVLPVATPVHLDVLDVHGRTVRDIGRAHMTAGDHVLTWDGLRNDGRPAGQGIYFLRANGPGIAASRSVVRLK